MKFIALIIGIIIFLIGCSVQHDSKNDKENNIGWWLVIGGGILWGAAANF